MCLERGKPLKNLCGEGGLREENKFIDDCASSGQRAEKKSCHESDVPGKKEGTGRRT